MMPSTILVVDDDEQIRSVLKSVLEEIGFHVVTAQNGVQALSGTLESSPDLILLDIKMPVLDGIDVLKHLTQISTTEKTKRPKIIIMTGYAELHNVTSAVQFRVDDFIAKPFDIQFLVARINRCIERID